MGMRGRGWATALALAAFALAGCGGGGGGGAAGGPETGGASEPITCESADDCVLVEDCCGCSAGGKKMAVHRERLDQVISSEAENCEQKSCGSGPSDDPSCEASGARCEQGRCVPDV